MYIYIQGDPTTFDSRIIRYFEQGIRTRRKFLAKQKFLDFKGKSRFYRVVYSYY